MPVHVRPARRVSPRFATFMPEALLEGLRKLRRRFVEVGVVS